MTENVVDSRGFEGALLGRSGNFLVGWARNLKHPDQEVTIELIGDEQWLATTRACLMLEAESSELNMPVEARGHSFAFNIQPHDWRTIARFEVRVANDGQHLNGVVFTHLNTHALPGVHSLHVESDGGLRLSGWAWDSLEPEARLKIHAYEGGRLIAQTLADRYCPEPRVVEAGFVKHGFNLTLPMELADGRVHEIQVVTEQGQVLDGSPIAIGIPATTPASWIKSLALPQQDSALLTTLMERYAWYVPVSADFSSYREWFHRFGKPVDFPDSAASVLIAIAGDDDPEQTLSSLMAQSHIHWTALVCGSSASPADSRIQYASPSEWESRLRSAIKAGVDIVSFIRSGDTVTMDALASLVTAFERPSVQIVYSDCDQLSDYGQTVLPWFKPDWDPDLFLSHTLLHHLFATRPTNLSVADPQIAEIDAWPWLAVQTVGDNPEAIFHIPRVLYHRRQRALPPVHVDAQRNCDTVIAPTLSRAVGDNGEDMLVWANPPEWPLVSLIVPTRDHVELLQTCVESLLKTDYPNLEIIVVDNDSVEAEALAYLDALQTRNIKVIRHPGVFNFSAINNHAVGHAVGSLIGLINNDIEAIEPGWLKAMVRHVLRPNVGAVGAKLLWPNGMVQHGGVILGLHGLVGHIGNDSHKDDPGYFGYNQTIHSASAVTAACLICRREDYLVVGGLDETDFPVNFNDVDFCLKLRRMGKRIVWTPEAQLLHAESASRGKDSAPHLRGRLAREKNRLLRKWQQWIMDDPYYNPNLNLDAYSHAGLAVPPRQRAS